MKSKKHKLTINKEYTTVISKEIINITIPTETVYLYQNYLERVIRIDPVYLTGEVTSLKFIIVDMNKNLIKTDEIKVSDMRIDEDSRSWSECLVYMLSDSNNYHIINRKTFAHDYKYVNEIIRNRVNSKDVKSVENFEDFESKEEYADYIRNYFNYGKDREVKLPRRMVIENTIEDLSKYKMPVPEVIKEIAKNMYSLNNIPNIVFPIIADIDHNISKIVKIHSCNKETYEKLCGEEEEELDESYFDDYTKEEHDKYVNCEKCIKLLKLNK